MAKSTDLVAHHLKAAPSESTPLTTPIVETSTFVFDSAEAVARYQEGKASAFLYSRYENPTVVAVEEALARLEGAEGALLFSSGMAAIANAMFGLLRAGDEVVCAAAIYGGTLHLIDDLLLNFGVERRFVSLEELAAPAGVIGPRTRLVWFESPINPTLRCVDVAAVGQACRAAGVTSVVDNTFATALNQPVLSMGIDLVMQSATKYLNGHSDVTAGVLAGSAEMIGRLGRVRRLLGGVLDPQPAYALGRGMKTMALRVARQNETALTVARAFERHPRIERVYYPGLESHPDHAIARKQMSGFGGMVCLDVKGGQPAAYRTFDRLQVIKRAASLGGVESICSLPILTSQYGLNDEELAAAGVTRGMMRLSIGLEDADDLVADLEQALADEG